MIMLSNVSSKINSFYLKIMATKYPNEPTGKHGLLISFCLIFGIPAILIIIAILMGKF